MIRTHWLALAIAAALLPAACTRTVLLEHRFRIPVPASQAGAARAISCIEQCEPRYWVDTQSYGECLAECPNAEVEAGVLCDPHEPPDRSWCYELFREVEVADETATGVVVDIVGNVFVAILEGAFSGPDEARSEKPSRARSRAPKEPEKVHPEDRVRAKPRRRAP